MKKWFLLMLGLMCIFLFTGCKCEHEWVEANCTTPRTCSLCEETEGAPLGHTWAAATCLNPKTCETCKETQGEALGHTWKAATCEAPETCSLCHETRGKALEHDWIEATTEAPKTCTLCHKSEGERIITDSRFTTTATKAIQGKWQSQVVVTGEMLGLGGYLGEMECVSTVEFGKDGKMVLAVLPPTDIEPLETALFEYTVDLLYYQLALEGLSKSQADVAMEQTYGMNVNEYVKDSLKDADYEEIFEDFSFEGVYYVDGNTIYSASDWADEFEPDEYELKGKTIVIEESAPNGSPAEWEKVEEE